MASVSAQLPPSPLVVRSSVARWQQGLGDHDGSAIGQRTVRCTTSSRVRRIRTSPPFLFSSSCWGSDGTQAFSSFPVNSQLPSGNTLDSVTEPSRGRSPNQLPNQQSRAAYVYHPRRVDLHSRCTRATQANWADCYAVPLVADLGRIA